MRQRLAVAALVLVATSCSSGAEKSLACNEIRGDVLVFAPSVDVGKDVLSRAAKTIKRRLNAYGHNVPAVCAQDKSVLVATGATLDAGQRDQIAKLLRGNVRLELRPVLAEVKPASKAYTSIAPSDCGDAVSTVDPRLPAWYCEETRDAKGDLRPPAQWPKLHLAPSVLGAAEISRASVAQGQPGNDWTVTLTLTDAGGRAFADATGKIACEKDEVKRQIAIAVDAVVQSRPAISRDVTCGTGIQGGRVVITTDGGESEARRLAADLAGVLPVPFRLATTNAE